MSQTEVTPLPHGGILRHGAATPWQPPVAESNTDVIADHIERHLGPIATVFHELASDTVHIDVHLVLPTAAMPVYRLVTSGMSDLPMQVPSHFDGPRHLELMLSLPGYWKLSQGDFNDEAWYWPVRLLKFLARLPHKHATWLGWGHTVPNGDPPEPLAPSTPLSGAILVPPVSAPAAFHTLQAAPDKHIQFLAVVPLHAQEMNFKLRRGSDALLRKFDRHGFNDVVDPQRPDVTRKRFWLF